MSTFIHCLFVCVLESNLINWFLKLKKKNLKPASHFHTKITTVGVFFFLHLPFLTLTSQVGDSDGSERPMSFLA